MKQRRGLMLLGRDHRDYGHLHVEALGPDLAGAISVGRDRESPSLRAKGDKSYPNEDALLILTEGSMVLAAVADSHFGIHASHALIEALHEVTELPRTRDDLEAALRALSSDDRSAGDSSASTLIALLYDREQRTGHYFSWGDSTLAAVGPGGFRALSRPQPSFVSPATIASTLRRGASDSFRCEPGERLLLYTDGINECHYREPETSITGDHIARLASSHPGSPETFAHSLTRLALEGVDGHPGGQDNIALIVMKI